MLDSNIKFHFLIDSGVTLHTIDDSDYNIVISSIVNMVDGSSIQNNPIRKVKEFIDKQNQYKSVSDVDHWRFVGYVLDISYESAQIITNDTYKC